MKDRNVILLGYRGSGKTTLGRQLAEKLNKHFVDVDDEVCRRFGNKTIAEIWAQDGEKAFRAVEADVTLVLCRLRGLVIALGGGTVMHPDARRAVENAPRTLSIYLKCDPRTLYGRIQSDHQTANARPALTSRRGLAEVEAVLAERESVYQAVADMTIDATDKSLEEVLRMLMSCL